MKFYITGAIALFSLLIITANIVPASAKDALYTDRIESIFNDMINRNQENIEKSGAILKKTGTINIEKADGYYAVTLPEMKIIEENGDITTIGMIAVNATPTQNIENWKMAVAMPMPIIKKNKDGQKLSQLNIAKQNFVGIYNDKIDNFTTLAIAYDDVEFSNYVDNKIIDSEEIRITSDLVLNDETLSGPSDIQISDITFADIDTTKTTKIDEINMEVIYDEIDILSIAQNAYNFDLKKLGGIKLKGEAKDIESDIKLSKFEFEFEGDKPDNGLSDQTLKIEYDGLKTKDIKSNMTEFVPANMIIDIDVNKLPLSELIRIGQMKMNAESDTPAAAINMLQSLTSLPTKMAQAGSNLDIGNFDFQSKLYEIKTRGKLKASDKSPLKIVGEIIMEANGLDKTESNINSKIDTVSMQEKNALQNMLKQINFIKSKCDGDKGDYTCNLNFSPEGKITLNNTQLSIFDAMQIMQK